MINLKYTYQPSKNLDEVNKQVTNLVELLKNELLQAATNENVESLVMKVEQTSDDGAKRLAEVNARVGDTAAIVGMMASYNSTTGKITVEAGLKAGIEESNIVLSGDHIILDGDVTINSGFKLSGGHITAGTITANQIAGNTITAAEIATGAITSDEIATGAITADKIDAGAISVQNLVNAYGRYIEFGSGIQIPSNWGTITINPLETYFPGISVVAIHGAFTGAWTSFYDNVMFSSSGQANFQGDTYLQGSVYADGIANPTHFTGAPNVRCAGSNNQLKIGDGSSRRFKHDIKPIEDKELNAHRLYDIPVIQFVYNDDYIDEDDQRYERAVPGFIAEDIQEIYPIACDLEADGRAHDWNYRFIIPPMLALIQEQNKRLERLEALHGTKDDH